MKYDLENRTRKFSKAIIQFLLKIKKHRINDSMISRLIRSAMSVGANYCEANGASSKKYFNNKNIYLQKINTGNKVLDRNVSGV